MFQFDAQDGAEKQIGQQIRKLRLEMGLTQEQFAVRLGVSFPTVNRWENQKAKPSPLALQKLQKLILVLKKKNQLKHQLTSDSIVGIN